MLSFSSLTIYFSRPYDCLGRVREASAGKVRRGIRLLPRDVVNDGITFQFQCHPYGVDVMEGTAYPDAPVVFQNSSARSEPFSVECQLFLRSHRLVPVPFVHGDLLPGMAGNPAAGKEIGRIGEDDVDVLLRQGFQNAVAVSQVQGKSVYVEIRPSFHS